ncbi:extensin-like [Vicia villosa]|uniref:extensin-like n=1 Tax=Vicia villosa TaxID=3911 RepID=UPI00273B4D99|nr:extensin-like [Vicia villosa]
MLLVYKSSVDRLCRQRQIPPGSIVIKNSRMVHMKPGSKNPPPPPPPTQRKHPPPIQTTKTPPPIQTNPTPPPWQPPSKTLKTPTPSPSDPTSKTQTNPPPPPIQSTPTPSPSHPTSTNQTNPTPPPIQTNPTPPPTDQPQPSIPTSEEFRFIPTPGYTHRVLQSPPRHSTEEGIQEEGDQALSNEEQEEQVDGQRPKIYIVEDTA